MTTLDTKKPMYTTLIKYISKRKIEIKTRFSSRLNCKPLLCCFARKALTITTTEPSKITVQIIIGHWLAPTPDRPLWYRPYPSVPNNTEKVAKIVPRKASPFFITTPKNALIGDS